MVDEWVGFNRIASKFKYRPIPIKNPIFQYSNIPVCLMQIITKLGNENLFGFPPAADPGKGGRSGDVVNWKTYLA